MTANPKVGSHADQGDPETGHAAARRLWGANPVGSLRSAAAPGEARYFADLRRHRYGYETPFLPRIFGLDQMAGRRVLEIGVGNGIDALEMARGGAIYTGIDVTARHLELTARNFELAGLDAPKLVLGDLLTSDVGGPFDVVYSFGVLHHIPAEGQYLRRARDLLAKDGRVLLGVYSRYSFFNTYLVTTWLAKAGARMPLDDWRSHVAEFSPLGDPVTIRIRSRREVEGLLRASGLTVRRYWKRGFVQRYIPGLGRYLAPDGPALNAAGALLGWYHLFECARDQVRLPVPME